MLDIYSNSELVNYTLHAVTVLYASPDINELH